ncbi:MAG: anti-sigma factor [Chloroflexi bacterium]|nr:anti-sigma factor [Chloroflexota bacterium]
MQYLLGPQSTGLALLVAEAIVLGGLFFGFYLIRYQRRRQAHHRVQTTLVLANMVLILAAMAFGFNRYVVQGGAASPAVARLMIGHATLGAVAEVMAVYILIRMSNLVPEGWRVWRFRRAMRATLALWTVVALSGVGVYYGQYVASAGSRTEPPPPPTTPVPPPTTPGTAGLVAWTNAQGFNDRITLTVVNMPPLASGRVYQGWLVSRASAFFQSLGVLEVHEDGTAFLEEVFATNPLTLYDQVVVTVEDAPASKAGPSPTVFLVGQIPPQAGVHLRHLLVEGPGSPSGLGFVNALFLHGPHLVVHAREIEQARQRGNLASMKRHAEHLITLIEGQSGPNYGDLNQDGAIQDPGDGLGLLPYARLIAEHAQLALEAPDATPAIKAHAPHIASMVDNVTRWATQVRDDALAVIAADSPQAVEAQVADAVVISARGFLGYDENGDGEIAPVPNEGGIVQVRAHAQAMAGLALRVQPGAFVQELHPPPTAPSPTPTPTPAPGTVTVLMERNLYRDKTLVVKRGTTVVWVNRDVAKHTVTWDAREVNSGLMSQGETFSFTFNEPGRFPYYCELHGDRGDIGMAGMVIVE